MNSLPLEVLARLLLGRWSLGGAAFSGWLNAHHDEIATRFRRETETVWLEDRDGVVRAHFLVGWDSIAAGEPATGLEKQSLHAEAMRRVTLLRGLFPDRSGYGCQGYGHRILPTDYDDTTKAAIRPENLPPDWAVEVNATALALAKWDGRLSDWEVFVARSWSRRQAISELLLGLRKALEAHFRDRKKRLTVQARLNLSAWEALRDALNSKIALPKQAVDPWGFISEDRQEKAQQRDKSEKLLQQFALSPYRGLLREQGELMKGLVNFLNQAWPYLFLDYRSKENEAASRQVVTRYVADKGQHMVKPDLTLHNLSDFVSHFPAMQAEFRGLFATRFASGELAEQERRERKEADAAMLLWQAYLDQPQVYMADPLGQIARIWAMTMRDAGNRLDQGFCELAHDGIVGRRLRRPVEWNGAPALWLWLDSGNVEFLATGPTRIKALLSSAIGEMCRSARQRLALERQWQTVVVVPTFGGKRVGKWVWVIPLHRILYGGEGASPFSWLDAMQYPVADEMWMQTDVPAWDTPEFRLANDLFAAIGAVQVLIAQLGDWLPLAMQGDSDAGVLEAYADRHVVAWLGVIRSLIERLTEVSGRFHALPPDQQSDRPYLMVAVSNIVDNLAHWFPAAMVSGHTRLSVSDLEQRLSTWTEHGDKLLGVYAALLLDAQESAAT
ncbi:MAG: hypothetical protein Q8M09_08785 [Pseudomonadota bacterium]|nr:hypothetical protein [Pseudomonadota bacterium]MDP1904324.1 hypothetical protein [Pseudomonadota bacterium]MDP2353451.1 hypothetical protein [Pseudomonadota bacterium]